MRILVLLQYYHTPDCPTAGRPHALVRSLAQHHDVTLITTHTGRQRRIAYRFDWLPDSVSLRELRIPYQNAMGLRARAWAFARYAIQACLEGLRPPRPDLIVASSTPLSVAATAHGLARWHGVPWVFEVRDLWPDFPVQMGAVPSAGVQRALYALERRLYRSAAHVVALSPDMATHVRRYVAAERVSMNPYGTDLALLRRAASAPADRQHIGRAGQHLVLYAGALGRANAIPTLLDAARRLRPRSDIAWAFVGDGYHRRTVAAAARELPNVHLLPPQPYPRTLALFRQATLSITSFIDRPVLRTNAPSKFMDSLAAGTPVVVTNPGWTTQLVTSGGCGWYVPPEDAGALARQVAAALDAPPAQQRAWQRNARHVACTQFDRDRHMQQYRTLLESLV